MKKAVIAAATLFFGSQAHAGQIALTATVDAAYNPFTYSSIPFDYNPATHQRHA